MFTFRSTPRQEQQLISPFTMIEPPKSTVRDLLSKGSPSFLAPGMHCKSMDVAESLDICETHFSFTDGEIVLTQTSTVVRYSVTYRSVFEGKK